MLGLTKSNAWFVYIRLLMNFCVNFNYFIPIFDFKMIVVIFAS